MIFANCSTSDSLLLERIHAKAAKLIPGCFHTSRNAAGLSDLNCIPLSNRRELHMFLSFYKLKAGLTSPVLYSFLPLTLEKYQPIHCVMPIIFSFPSRKVCWCIFQFFYKTRLLWNSLRQYIKLSSIFAAFKNRINHFYHGNKRNTCQLRGSSPFTTSLRCVFRLGHSSPLIWSPFVSVAVGPQKR